jgi:hypothetical protein
MPTGNDAQTVEAYYNALTAHALQAIPAPRTVINWAGPGWIALFATALILFFLGYSMWFQHRTLRHDELYRVISFGGTVFERIGGIPVFEGVIWAGIVVWALYFMIGQALGGLYY